MAEQGSADDFIQLFTAHQSSFRRAYVLSLVPRWSDAEEIVQQCSLILWKKFSQFRPGTNFFAWACQVARLEVKDFRKRQRREQIVFSDEFIDAVADEVFEMQAELPAQLHALQGCVEKLSRDQRELLRLRYNEGGWVALFPKPSTGPSIPFTRVSVGFARPSMNALTAPWS